MHLNYKLKELCKKNDLQWPCDIEQRSNLTLQIKIKMQGGPMQVLQRTNEAKQNLDENIHCKTL